MLRITDTLTIPDEEIELAAVRSQGAGGQNVNKVSSAIHLRFNIPAASLPENLKQRLLRSGDSRITKDGVLVLKAQESRTQERNKAEALDRLAEIIRAATVVAPPRRPTKPSRSARRKRTDAKTRRGAVKALRGGIRDE